MRHHHIVRFTILHLMLFIIAPSATAQEERPLESLGRVLEVQGYPVSGKDDAFAASRRTTIDKAVAEVIAERGEPLLREQGGSGSTIRLVYPNALVTVTGEYSNRLICRIDLPTSVLRDGLPVSAVTELAARSCRAAEERGWGPAVKDNPTPIGTEPLPGVTGATARLFATDAVDLLFPLLVRTVEVDGKTSATLVRGRDPNTYSFSGTAEWRYAWFADGTMLALRYWPGQRENGPSGIGFACTMTAQAESLHLVKYEAFAEWCDRHANRLRGGLPAFVSAIQAFRRKQAAVWGDAGGGVRMADSFHHGAFSPELTSAFWRTGSVPNSSTP